MDNDYDISQFLKRVKQSVSAKARSRLLKNDKEAFERFSVEGPDGKWSFRFWMASGGYDRNISKERTLWKMINYIHCNPVRGRLVKETTDWKWSSARFYEFGETGPVDVHIPDR
jgi:REP-associated tyrosine transposase